jgi:hypothetical protein
MSGIPPARVLVLTFMAYLLASSPAVVVPAPVSSDLRVLTSERAGYALPFRQHTLRRASRFIAKR